MHRVKACVVSGSRSEFGQLLPLLLKLEKDEFFNTSFVLTGAHLASVGGRTLEEIKMYPVIISKCIPINGIEDNSRKGVALQISNIITSFTRYFEKHRPDVLIVIGDRYEMYSISLVAATLLIPIVHICGGSTTSGALDEIYRHSITKMASLHFVTCDVYRKRVIQLGEHPDRVFTVGSLAIENCLHMDLYTEIEFRKIVQLDRYRPYCVVTFHPVTLEKDSSIDELNALIDAMDYFEEYDYIITLSNIDCGGELINDLWRAAATKRKNFKVFPSLGMKKYLTALKYSEMMIGNSSSGTTEGPAMGIPIIDIGDRQKGRVFAASLIHCEPQKEEIIRSISKARTADFKKMAKMIKNPFGDGKTSEKMMIILKEQIAKGLEVKKDFYDVKFEVK